MWDRCLAFFLERLARQITTLTLVLACVLLGAWLGRAIWPFVRLPFSNPYEVVGFLSREGITPTTNQARFVVFAMLPTLLFLVLLSRRAWRAVLLGAFAGTPGVQEVERPGFVERLAYPAALAVVSGHALLVGLGIFGWNNVGLLDLFHNGEQLTPAWNFLATGGLWTRSYFAHGVFYDPLSAVLGWKVFGGQSVVALRLVQGVQWPLIGAAFAFFVVMLARALRHGRLGAALAIQTVLFVYLISQAYQYFEIRDISVLVCLGILVTALAKGSRVLAFTAGLFSALAYANTIDRGAYLSVALVLVAALCVAWPRAASLRSCGFSIFAGIAAGWLAFWALVGTDELLAFARNTGMFYQTKDWFDSFVYPQPGTGAFRHTLPMVLIAVQLLGFAYFFFARYRKSAEALPAILHGLLVAFSVFYFRSALGRSDTSHIMSSTAFTFVGTGYLAYLLLADASRRTRTVLATLLVLVNTVLVWRHDPPPSWESVTTLRQRVTAALARPEESFLEPDVQKARIRLYELFSDEPCVTSLTAASAWPYLLRKPSCDPYYVLWFTSPRFLWERVLANLERRSPRYIIVDAQAFREFDGIPFEERMPGLFAYVNRNYELLDTVAKWQVLRKRAQ